MLNSLMIGLLSAAIVLAPVVIVIGVIEWFEKLEQNRQEDARREKYAAAMPRTSRNRKEDEEIRRVWAGKR